MSTWLNILIDIGILSLIGLMYYFWQKKRIIRVSHEAIVHDLENFRLKLNEFVQSMVNNEGYQVLKNFSDQFEELFQTGDIEGFDELSKQDRYLSSELKNDLKALNDQITDHLVSR